MNNRDRIRVRVNEQRKARWRKITPEELELCRKDPRLASPKQHTILITTVLGPKDIVCLECGAIRESLIRHLGPIHALTARRYKRSHGYNPRTPLTSHNLHERRSRLCKRRGLSAKLKAHRRPFGPFRKPPHSDKMPLEYCLDLSEKRKGRARPELWKKSADGKVATDVEIAQLHLQGFTRTDIAKRVGLKYGESVTARLQRMGYPNGRACLYEHGERVTGRNMLDCCQDLRIPREKLAEKMRVRTQLVYQRTAPSRRGRPLPVPMARTFLSAKESLRDEYGHQVTTQKGGRPPVLLPSEKKALPVKYGELRSDLRKLRRHLREQKGKLNMMEVWAWLCQQSHPGLLRTLVFWPQFFDWLKKGLDAESFLVGCWVPNELAIQFLAGAYKAAFDTVKSAVFRLAEGEPRLPSPP